jgi:signal transduction histidine kinase
MLRPLDAITAAATRISASTLHDRIALDGPDDEVRRLGHTFNDLIARLEAAFDSQRRFVAQASHELQTPLAVQRAAIQIGLHDDVDREELIATREQLLEQNRASALLVESLLTLAEVERGLDGRVQQVDLTDAVTAVVEDFSPAADAAGVTMTTQLADGIIDSSRVIAEPILLRQLLANLVDNAIEYNEPGGWVTVRLLATGFLVENTGAVVPVEVAATLAEPFSRGTQPRGSRRHSGLGLSIVAAIAHAHGWTIELQPRARGGLVATVSVSPMQLPR